MKGISPLISWVLIIGFSIAMATFITIWAIDQTKKIDFETPTAREHCSEVRISFEDVCMNLTSNTIKSTIKNTGNFKIVIATFAREAVNLTESSCAELNLAQTSFPSSTNPGDIFTYQQYINGSFSFNQTQQNITGIGQLIACQGPQMNQGYVGPVTKFSMIPWIRIEEEYIPCQDQKIEINDILKLCN